MWKEEEQTEIISGQVEYRVWDLECVHLVLVGNDGVQASICAVADKRNLTKTFVNYLC